MLTKTIKKSNLKQIFHKESKKLLSIKNVVWDRETKKKKKKMVSFCKQSTAHLLKQVTTSDKIMRNQRIMQWYSLKLQ